MYNIKKIFFVILIVVVFIIDVIISYKIGLALISYNSRANDVFVKKIKEAMIKYTVMSDAELEIINTYSFDHNKSPHKKFNNWDSDEQPFGEMCKFGFKLLEYYGYNKQPNNYLRIVEDIILRIDKALTNVSKFVYYKTLKDDAGDDTSNIKNITLYPWGKNWYEFSVYVPRLMIMYEYIGRNECIKKYVCHKNICRLIPALDKSLDIFRKGANMVYIGLPRLLTNYLYDRVTYDAEKKSQKYDELSKVYNIEFLTDGIINEGMYEDGSYIYHKNVATYSYLVTLYFYNEKIFEAINGTNKLPVIVKPILEKLLHPTIPYTTLGLFGRNGDRISKNWWNIKGKLGIGMMPFIGLGVFKTKRFMFSLRVQRPGIAAYETDKDFKGEFALGWIQLRKMYLARDYPNPLTWDILKNEPGILSIKNESFTELLPSKDDHTVDRYLSTGTKNSYVGRLIDYELMFWKNQYLFKTIYDCSILELGIATHNGIEIYYEIENNENRTLQFRVIDNYNLPNGGFETDVEGAAVENGFVYVHPHELKKFTFREVFDLSIKTKIKSDKKTKNMQFNYGSNKYVIEPVNMKGREKKLIFYKVSCFNDADQLMYIIGGSSSSKLQDELMIDTIKLIRNPETLMYVKLNNKFVN